MFQLYQKKFFYLKKNNNNFKHSQPTMNSGMLEFK